MFGVNKFTDVTSNIASQAANQQWADSCHFNFVHGFIGTRR